MDIVTPHDVHPFVAERITEGGIRVVCIHGAIWFAHAGYAL